MHDLLPGLFARFRYETPTKEDLSGHTNLLKNRLHTLLDTDRKLRYCGEIKMTTASNALRHGDCMIPQTVRAETNNTHQALVVTSEAAASAIDWFAVPDISIFASWTAAKCLPRAPTACVFDPGESTIGIDANIRILALGHNEYYRADILYSTDRWLTDWALPAEACVLDSVGELDRILSLVLRWGYTSIGIVGGEFLEPCEQYVKINTLLAKNPGRCFDLTLRDDVLKYEGAPRLPPSVFFKKQRNGTKSPVAITKIPREFQQKRAHLVSEARASQIAFSQSKTSEARQHALRCPPLSLYETIERIYLQGKGQSWTPKYHGTMANHAALVQRCWT